MDEPMKLDTKGNPIQSDEGGEFVLGENGEKIRLPKLLSKLTVNTGKPQIVANKAEVPYRLKLAGDILVTLLARPDLDLSAFVADPEPSARLAVRAADAVVLAATEGN